MHVKSFVVKQKFLVKAQQFHFIPWLVFTVVMHALMCSDV